MRSVIAGCSPVRRALCLFGLALILGAFGSRPAAAAGEKVDVALVLGVDVSWSMDHNEQLIQRDGYAAAFRSKQVLDAILDGGYGRIAVTYVEWAGATTQITVVPWTLIDSASAARAFAAALTMQEPQQLRRTSISGAIAYAHRQLDASGYTALRRIIDISGDGPNNDGGPVTAARDAAVAAGITINGLPLMTNTSDTYDGFSVENLDKYYADCVIGGGQAFVIPVTSWEEFPQALRRKLVLELAGAPASGADSRKAGHVRVIPVRAEQKSDCDAGEKLWHQRWQQWQEP